MGENNLTSFQDIYETMLGQREPEFQVPGVEDAFEPGLLCDQAYSKMRDAYERVCQRLGCRDEDGDLDCIVDCMELIQQELCRRMFSLRLPRGPEHP